MGKDNLCWDEGLAMEEITLASVFRGEVGKGRVVCRMEGEVLGCLRLTFIPLLRI